MLIGKILKQRYEIIKEIGRGAFGNTYIAVDRDFPGLPHRVVKHLCPTHTDPASLTIAKKLFKTEAECLSKLGEYSQIPRLFSYFEEENEFYLVQELVEGHDLTHEFQPGKKWSESKTVDFLRELLSILSLVHQNDRIHRDIKPANIMRRRDDGKLVLIDFGAVKEVLTVDKDGQTTTVINSTIGIGTPAYMPAEQAMGKPGKYSDIYAVGILGVQALTGLAGAGLPLDSEGLRRIWQSSGIEVSSKLKSILERMISFQYRQRYPDAESALKALAHQAGDVTLLPLRRSVSQGRALAASDAHQESDRGAWTESNRQTTPSRHKKKILLFFLAALGLTGVGAATQAYLARPNYTQLETYLQNKQWQKADVETNKIILEIAREPSELDTQSAKKFSCKALEKIDRLWMENSDGRFGFTPQKQAYLETGNKFGEPAESMYKKFGDRLGWWSNKNFGESWNMYKDLNFKNNDLAPVGHLPSPGTKADKMTLRRDEPEMLLSRFDRCGL